MGKWKKYIDFPEPFSSRTRTVELDGEAYFDVRKNPEKQFIVSTTHQSAIKVLGTKFNVKAYKEADEVITTLVEGKVNFEFNNASQQPQYIVMAPDRSWSIIPRMERRNSIQLPARENFHGKMAKSFSVKRHYGMHWISWQIDTMPNLSYRRMYLMTTHSPEHLPTGIWNRYLTLSVPPRKFVGVI